MVTSFKTLLYLVRVKPFKLEFANKMEIMNESVILALSYFTWGFSDYSDSIEIKNKAGFAYSIVVIMVTFFNFAFIII